MPRAARVDLPGGTFHIISRTLNREFLIEDEDRLYYLALLGRALEKTDARVVAWCLMSNHVHLVVIAGDEPLWRLMKSVHSGFANWRNRRTGRLGPVFAERYRSILVEADTYLLELVRYVHLNPVRAGLASLPEQSVWSSHRAYVGLEPAPAWLATDVVFGEFSADREAAAVQFGAFVREGVGSGRNPDLSGDALPDLTREVARAYGLANRVSHPILGSEAFVQTVFDAQAHPATSIRLRTRNATARRRPAVSALIDVVCAAAGLDRLAFDEARRGYTAQRARWALTWLWVTEYRARRIDLARALGVFPEQVTRWHAKAVRHYDELRETLERVMERLPDVEPDSEVESGDTAEATQGSRVTVNVHLKGE